LILTILSIRILTASLSLSEIASYGIVMSISLILSSAISTPFSMYMNRMANEWKQDNTLQLLMQSYIVMIISIAVGLLGLFYFFRSIIDLPIYIQSLTFSIALLYFVSSSINWCFVGLLNTIGQTARHLSFNILTILPSLILSYVAINVFGENYYWWIVGLALGQIIIGLYIQLTIVNTSSKTLHEKYANTLRYNLSYNNVVTVVNFVAPLSLVMVLSSFLINWYRLMPVDQLDLNSLGLIVVCFILSNGIFSSVEQAASTIFQPAFYKDVYILANDDKNHVFFNYAEKMIATLVIFLGLYISTIDILSRYLLPNEFDNLYVLLLLCGAADFFRILSNILSIRYHSEKKTKKGLLPIFIPTLFLICFLYFNKYDINNHEVVYVSMALYITMFLGHVLQLSGANILYRFISSRLLYIAFTLSALLAVLITEAKQFQIPFKILEPIILLFAVSSYAFIWIKHIMNNNGEYN
jgi:hypothetical protein